MNTCSHCGYRTFAEIPPIPAPNLLGTNHAPSLCEARLIQGTISGVSRDLWQLNNEISRVQTLLYNLMRNRDALRTYYDRQRALLSPIRRLPPEILSEIFLACSIVHLEGKVVFPMRKVVLLPGQICRYWRDIALSTPRLWSSLYFDLGAQHIGRELDMAPTWLARSGGVPLTLGLFTHQENAQTHPVIDVVLAHAPRFYILRLEAPLSIVYSLQSAKGRIPRLHRLIINWSYSGRSPIPQSLDIFEFAPKLCCVELRRKVSVLKPKFPWAQLHELRLLAIGDRFTVDDYLQILHDSPNLVTSEVNLNNSQGHHPRTIVRNSNLRELHVDLTVLHPLFDGLALPALLSLSCFGHDRWPRDEFLSFLHRSSFSLQKLVLSAFFGDHLDDYRRHLLECLLHTPNLLELELLEGAGAATCDAFWHDLTHRVSSPCLLPKLRRITVTRYFELDYDTFVAMVESRWRVDSAQGVIHTAVERIQYVEVRFMIGHEYWDDYRSPHRLRVYSDCFARLRQFRAEGLDVIVPDMDQDKDDSGSESESSSE